ncbi:MAG: penicillin acylase family protein [Caldilineales bacterium]|nr:penicillin acylase family protein [Caldilineales bacterium]
MSPSLAIILSVLLILGAAAILLIYWALIYRPHPRIEGSLRIRGLQAPVEVLRDRWGVPHIYAQNEHDLWFAQGFVHAQDRLWQMEMFRRIVSGRLSEGVGEEALAVDRLARVVGFRRLAEMEVTCLNEDAREALESYVAGVNAFLAAYRNRLPMEFALLGIKPGPWTVADSLGIGLLLGWGLTHNWQEELARVTLYTRLGPERAAELIPDYPPDSPLVLPGELDEDLSRELLDAYRRMGDYIGLTAPGTGSNNWVINGSKSLSGKPLLANDPHLPMSMPGLWYLVHLESANGKAGRPIRLIGAGMPGVPAIMVGHNEHIAWGATSAAPDTADLFVEQRHPQNPSLFRFGEDWEEAQVWDEEIWVRGLREPVVQRVTVTRHGPILNDVLAEHESNFPPLALRWVAQEPVSSANALMGIIRATNWEEFRAAAMQMTTPAISYVYADTNDNIGYIAGGTIPVRSQGLGLVPSPGYTGESEWSGFIPPEELPQAFNPDNGQLFSANNRITPSNYPYWWGADQFPGYRARRIAEMLQTRPRFSLRDFQSMQLDTYNYLGQAIAPYFTLIDPTDTWERRAQKALVEWNYRMDKDSMAAIVFELVVYHLLQLVFVDKLGPGAADYIGVARMRELGSTAFSYQAAAKLAELLQAEESWWFGEGTTGRERTREQLLSQALTLAVETLKREIGDDARRWQWGRLHQVLWRHPLGELRFLRGMLNRGPYPVAGNGFTVNAQHLEFSMPIRTVTVGPTFRMVVDLANWDRSTFVCAPGQSGLPGHRFYDSMMHIWLEGEMIPMAFSRQKVEQSDRLYRLELTPAA